MSCAAVVDQILTLITVYTLAFAWQARIAGKKPKPFEVQPSAYNSGFAWECGLFERALSLPRAVGLPLVLGFGG